MYLNKAIVIGNLTRDPESRALPSGIKVTTFSLATNRVWKDKDGAQQKNTDYHNIVVFGRQAETVAQYLKKGSSALVEGRMQTRSWEGKDGEKKYRTEIVADRVQFGPRREGGSMGGANKDMNEDTVEAKGDDTAQTGGAIEYPQENINPEDIPF